MRKSAFEIKRAKGPVGRELEVWVQNYVRFRDHAALVVKNTRRRRSILRIFREEQNVFRRLRNRNQAHAITCHARRTRALLVRSCLLKLDIGNGRPGFETSFDRSGDIAVALYVRTFAQKRRRDGDPNSSRFRSEI